MQFERKSFQAQPYLYVAKECSYEGDAIADAMGAAFGEVFGFIAQTGITPLSMPITVYHGMDPKTLRFQSGVFVSEKDAAKAKDPVKAGQLPACDAMTTTHQGPYTNLNQSHGALWKHMEEAGIEGAMPVWEIYVDDPEHTAPDQLRTEIYRAIA